jgi:integrase
VVRYTQHLHLFFTTVRARLGLRADDVVRASVLSRDLLMACWRTWQDDGRSESYVYGTARSVLDMWDWVSDDPDQYPGVPTPPRNKKAVLPLPPLYIAPPAPTLAEADACLRQLSLDSVESRRIGAFLRFTGLRIDQVVHIRRRDIDLGTGTLTVTTGKSRLEKAERRVVPVAAALLKDVRPWAEALPPDAWLFPARGVIGSAKPAAPRSDTFSAAWKEATKWGEAREGTWKPENRKNARPEHVFRAALLAALQAGGASELLMNALVGHAGKTTRSHHYAGADSLFTLMKAAVDALPPIDWDGPLDRGSKISLAKRRQSERRTLPQSTG